MKSFLGKLASLPLSPRAKRSSIVQLVGRYGFSMVAVPTAGYGLGMLADRFWPGEISWALTLGFLGFAIGCVIFWAWVKQARANYWTE